MAFLAKAFDTSVYFRLCSIGNCFTSSMVASLISQHSRRPAELFHHLLQILGEYLKPHHHHHQTNHHHHQPEQHHEHYGRHVSKKKSFSIAKHGQEARMPCHAVPVHTCCRKHVVNAHSHEPGMHPTYTACSSGESRMAHHSQRTATRMKKKKAKLVWKHHMGKEDLVRFPHPIQKLLFDTTT
jgi:hypothetical protein